MGEEEKLVAEELAKWLKLDEKTEEKKTAEEEKTAEEKKLDEIAERTKQLLDSLGIEEDPKREPQALVELLEEKSKNADTDLLLKPEIAVVIEFLKIAIEAVGNEAEEQKEPHAPVKAGNTSLWDYYSSFKNYICDKTEAVK